MKLTLLAVVPPVEPAAVAREGATVGAGFTRHGSLNRAGVGGLAINELYSGGGAVMRIKSKDFKRRKEERTY